MRDSIVNHNEAPFASHLLYTQPHILNEHIPEEREIGINTGLEFTRATERTVMYTDLGITKGMEKAIASAEINGVEVEIRKLSNSDWELYLHDTLNLKPVPTLGRVVWEDEIPTPPEMPPNRIIKEDEPYVKYIAFLIPVGLILMIVFGIADKVGWI
jgi:hypothetical protein